METLAKLNLKQRLEMRPYQEEIVQDIVNNFGINKPYVLGSCPSSGKTEMAIEAMVRLIESGQVNRVLVLAHSTNVLKENFYERLIQYFDGDDMVDIMNGRRRYNHNALIQVMIPQNIGKITGQFDLVVTDEAHHNVLAEDGNYSRIIEMVKPKFQLLLTGTPSKFIRENGRLEEGQEELYYIKTVGMDLIGFENFHDVRFDLIKSAYGFTNEDYNQSKNISEETKFSFEETERTINNVIIGAVRNIALRNGITLAKNSDFIKEGKELIKQRKFGKTLIMCRNIEQANQVKTIISKLFEIKVHVSESKSDTDSINLTKFKDNEFDFLCVVNRAREGYDDKKIINLIDITMTHNIDLIYQMFCRVVRKDVDNPNPKLYLKVTSNAEGMPEYTMNIMTASLMLGSTENLSRFNGSNFRNIVMPRVERDEVDGDETGEEDDVTVNGTVEIVDNEDNQIRRRRISELMALDLIRIFSEDYENLIHGNDRYAMTTLGESLDILNGVIKIYDNKEGYFKLIKEEDINSSNVWLYKYKELREKYGIKYHSTPWDIFNQTSKEFFDECYPNKLNFYDDKEHYFKLISEENILGVSGWLDKYKELSERDGVKYHSTPWSLFDQSGKDFFDECYGSFFDDKEGYFKILREENITTNHEWCNKYKELSERDGVKYRSNPWNMFKQTVKEFFDECYLKRYADDKEHYFKLLREENITGVSGWSNKYKELRERDNIIYKSKPWRYFNQTEKNFFDECYGSFFDKKEEYFKILREENITGVSGWHSKYKELSERDGIRYHSNPWDLFKQTGKLFFNECYGSFFDDKDGYFKLIRKENITNNNSWLDRYKELSEIDGIRYNSQPWRLFKQTVKDFFNEYRKWLKTHPKREFNQDHLGEVSRITKMGKTTSSEHMSQFFKENPQEFFNYHKLRKDNMDYWDEAPYEEIAKKITDPNDKVIDFGCGSNDLKKELKNNQVTPIDHIAFDESVIACDMTDISKFVDDNSHDVAVFSLSLWGTQENRESYLKEAFRVLKRKGVVYVAEAIGDVEKLEAKKEKMIHVITNAGFDIIDNIDVRERFIYITGIKM